MLGMGQTRSTHDWEVKGSTTRPPNSRENPTHGIAPSREEPIGSLRFADFDLEGKVCIVTGGAQGLGLALAEGLVEAGANGNIKNPSLPDPTFEILLSPYVFGPL